jgi:uncharacterized membrane protein YdbT with pleckstrin-like domain
MSYVAGVLQPGERVSAIGRLHWIRYRDAVIIFPFSIALFWVAANDEQIPPETALLIEFGALVLLAGAIYIAVKAWFDQWTTEIAVTNRRVIYKRGFIKRFTAEMNMDKIESVTVTQSMGGRILNYGSIHVRGTGEGIELLHKIRAPIALRNCITAR